MDEGARTLGVWLPLALADLFTVFFASLRIWAKDPDQVKIPKRSEILHGWMLPMMARAIKADEDEAEALALYRSVQNLAAKQMEKPQ